MALVQKSNSYVLDTTKLDALIAQSPGKVSDVVGKTAFRVLTRARVITPRDPNRPPVDPDAYKPSGELRANSDVVKQDPKGLTQNVEFFQEYAAAQELGNPAQNLPARPYLTPSVEEAAEQFVKDLAEILNQ